MTKRGLLIVVSGPSGVGKDTMLKPFMREHPECMLSISATTRTPRPGEQHGVDYFFVTRERFEQLIAAGEVLEWAEYSGNLYGTPRQEVEQQLVAGKHVILEIELKGAMKVKENCPEAVFVFLMPPSMQELRRRLDGRGTETPESMECRMRAARQEVCQANEYDYIIVNHSIEESAGELAAIIKAESCSVKYMQGIVQEVCSNA